MKHTLDLISNIPDEARSRFYASGVFDMDKLLSMGRTLTGRKELSQKTEISEPDILRWVEIADLLRVKGVGVKLAQLLSEIHTANSVYKLSRATPEELYEAIKEANDSSKLIKNMISKNAATELIKEAKELRIVLTLDDPVDFSDHQTRQDSVKKARANTSAFTIKTFNFLYRVMFIGFALFTCIIALIGKNYWFSGHLQMSLLMNLVEMSKRLLIIISFGQFVLAMAMMVWVWRKISAWLKALLDRLEDWWFQKSIYRQLALDLNFLPENADSFRNSVLIGIALIIGYGILLIKTDFFAGHDGVRAFTSTLVGVVIVILIMIPTLKPLVKIKDKLALYTSGAVRRYRTWMLVNWLYIPVIILFFIQLFNLLMGVNRFLMAHVHIPVYEKVVIILKSEIVGMKLVDEDAIETREYFTKMYTTELPIEDEALILFYDSYGAPIEKLLLSFVVPIVIWIIISSMIAFFIVPLFIFGKFRQAILFLGFAFLSYITEEFLSTYAASLFFLPPGSLTTIIFLSAVILSNTAIFDLVQEESSGEVGFCIICGRDHDKNAKYCPHCGNAIEES